MSSDVWHERGMNSSIWVRVADSCSPALILFNPSFWYSTFRCVLCRSPSSIFYSIFSSWGLRICWEAEHSASLLPLASLCFIHVFAVIIMFCTTGNTSQHFTYHCFMDFHDFWLKGWSMTPRLFFQCHYDTQTFFLACGWYFETQLWTTSAPLRWNSATVAWVGNQCISE